MQLPLKPQFGTADSFPDGPAWDLGAGGCLQGSAWHPVLLSPTLKKQAGQPLSHVSRTGQA